MLLCDTAHCVGAIPQMNTRKEEHLMFNNALRWILPFLVIALIAVYLVLSPTLSTHAAAPSVQQQQHTVSQHKSAPNVLWRP